MDEFKWYDDSKSIEEVYESIKLANQAQKESELKEIYNRQEEKFMKLLENNVSTHGAREIHVNRNKKSISKSKFRKIALEVTKRGLPLLIAIMISLGGLGILDKVKNKEVNENIDYVTSFVIPDVVHELTKDGFSEKSIMYFVKENYGFDGLDLMANQKEYYDGGEYIISQGYKDEVRSSNGETLYYELPREAEFFKDSKKTFVEEASRKNLEIQLCII